MSPASYSRSLARFLAVLLLIALPVTASAPSPQAHAADKPVPAKKPAAPQKTAPILQEEMLRIAAVVNDQLISGYDLAARTEFVLATSNQPPTQATRQRLAPEVLRQLIDETLERQEVVAKGITVSDAEVEQATLQLEESNRVPPGTFHKILDQNQLPRSLITAQISIQLAWRKLLLREIRQNAIVSEEDIDEALGRIRANRGKPEYAVAEILLPVDRPEADAQTRNAAQQLVEQVRQGGSFVALAQQLYNNAVPVSGSDLGWVQPEQLDPELDAMLRRMHPGDVSDPIRTPNGYHLLWLRGSRTAGAVENPAAVKIAVARLNLAAANDPAREAAAAKLVAAARTATSCADLTKIASAIGGTVERTSAPVALTALIPTDAQAVATLGTGQISAPLPTPQGVSVLMVCQRTDDGAGTPNREEIRQQIFLQRLEAFGRRYLRDLRTAAYIDIRIS